MAAKTKKKPRARKPRQQWIPGAEPLSIPEIDAAAEHYRTTRRDRAALSVQEREEMYSLVELMKKHDLPAYETADGFIVYAISKTKCAVKKKKDKSESNGEAE